jgi:hypothetical protein
MKNQWIEKKEKKADKETVQKRVENKIKNQKIKDEKERNKKHTPSWAYYVTVGLMFLLNLADGPPIGYLIIGFGFPWLAKQTNN